MLCGPDPGVGGAGGIRTPRLWYPVDLSGLSDALEECEVEENGERCMCVGRAPNHGD